MRTLVVPRVRVYVCGHARPQVDATFTWCPTRPHEIALRITPHGVLRSAGGEWIVGRDLLAAGIDRPAGFGDLMVSPDPLSTATDDADRHVEMVFSTPTHPAAALKMPAAPLRGLLDYTFSVVLAGDEGAHLDWDITELTGGAV